MRAVGCMVEEGLEREALSDLGARSLTEEDEKNALWERRGGFRNLAGQTVTMTVQMCVERCWILQLHYAAIQAGNRCYCSRTLKGLSKLNETACYERCSGNCNQRCGAAIAISVFETGYQRVKVRDYKLIMKFFMGCYKRSLIQKLCRQKQRTGSKSDLVTGVLTPTLCLQYCAAPPRQFYVSVLKAKNACCCGSDVEEPHRHGRWRDAKYCDEPCGFDSSQRKYNMPCIGQGVAVYEMRGWEGRGYPERLRKFKTSEFSTESAAGWLWPKWPVGNYFELPEALPRPEDLEPPQKLKEEPETLGQEAGSTPQPEQPVVEPDNAGVDVVDVPVKEEETGVSVGLIVGIVVSCLIVLAAILYIVFKRKKDSMTDTEKAIAMMESKENANAHNSILEEKRRSAINRKFRRRQEREEADGTTGEDSQTETPDDENEAVLEPLLL